MNKSCKNCEYRGDGNCIQTLCIPEDYKYWKPLKVYISGPITGVKNYRKKFEEAAQKIREQGLEPVNPCEGEEEGHEWEYYMKRDIKKLMDCQAIFLIPGWEKSRGAQVEAALASELKIEILVKKNQF